MSDTEKNYPGSEKKDGGKKKEGKKDKKEKEGYVMFDSDASDSELMAQEDLKSPSKMKKGKPFRFGPKKDIFPKVKEEKKEKEGKKEEKEKRKEEKEGKKHKLKVKKKTKHHDMPKIADPEYVFDKPVFGVPLNIALERNRSHDGIQLPALFRECIDYIEEHGLHCEGIYRISGVKSKVQHLKDSYNRGEPACLEEHEPNIVAGVLKQFLRELPDPVLTNALIPKFEEASTIRNERKRIEGFLKLINELPECNRLLLSWMIVHMTHVIERQKDNKMTLQNVSIVLSPTMQISHRVLNVLFSHTKQLFKTTTIKRYIPPLKPATSKWSLELPDNPQALQEELLKQESLLNQLHQELAAGEADPEKEEQIWEVQRVCTQLKRKIKLAQKNQDTLEKRKKDREELTRRNTVPEDGEEELRLELREPPECEVLRLELRKPPEDAPQAEEFPEEELTPVGDSREEIPSDDQNKVEDDKLQKPADEKQTVTLKELASQSEAKNVQDESKTVADVELEASEVREVAASETEINEEKRQLNQEEIVANLPENVENTLDKDENMTKNTDTEEVASDVEKVDEESKDLTAEEVLANMEQKHALMLQEDTTDSELGRSLEDIEDKGSDSEDEFEHSLEEILERECTMDSDKDITDHETADEKLSRNTEESELDSNEDSVPKETKTPVPMETKTPVPMETKTPVPIETPESPPPVTPVPQQEDEAAVEEVVLDVSELMDKEAMLEMEISEVSDDESFDEEEYQRLIEEEYSLKLEEEELLAIERELRKKIETERCETDRLQQEIDELQYLRQDSDEEVMSSSSDSSYESEDEDDLQEILNQLIKDNEDLERRNGEMCGKIHEERMICLDVKVQIGIIQQKQVQNSVGNDTFMEKDSLIEFD